jgi:hypothetical protein
MNLFADLILEFVVVCGFSSLKDLSWSVPTDFKIAILAIPELPKY